MNKNKNSYSSTTFANLNGNVRRRHMQIFIIKLDDDWFVKHANYFPVSKVETGVFVLTSFYYMISQPFWAVVLHFCFFFSLIWGCNVISILLFFSHHAFNSGIGAARILRRFDGLVVFGQTPAKYRCWSTEGADTHWFGVGKCEPCGHIHQDGYNGRWGTFMQYNFHCVLLMVSSTPFNWQGLIRFNIWPIT